MLPTKSISVRREVFESLQALQQRLTQEIGLKISMADAIQYLINHYEKTNGK
jgi:predicted CopG family antitoxin